MIVINFYKLWLEHHLNWVKPDKYPCKNLDAIQSDAYNEECAIRMSLALTGAGVNMNTFNGEKCKYRNLEGHKNHFIRAYELAKWLDSPTVLGKSKKFPKQRGKALSAEDQAHFWKHQGIVFFENFYAPDEKFPNILSGDHIDVWNLNMMAGDWEHKKTQHYFDDSERVWFWEIKS